MKKPLVSVLLSAAMLLSAGAARSWADTITFNNNAIHPDGTVTVGNTISLTGGIIESVAHVAPLIGFSITGSCPSLGGGGSFGCLSLTTGSFVGPVTSTTANDYAYMGGGIITITGAIAALGLGPNTVLWTGTYDVNSNVILQFDDVCNNPPNNVQCTGSVSGNLSSGTLNPILAAAMGVSPSTVGGNDQSLFFSFAGLTLPAAGAFPSGTASGNTNQLEIVTPAAVPESGSLILVGIGLVAGAKYLRRRRLA